MRTRLIAAPHAVRAARCTVVLLAVLAACAATARAGTADRLADVVAHAWVAAQQADGSFPDYITARTGDGGARDRYGPSMLGAALLAHGTRTGDDVAVAAGLKALGYASARMVNRQTVIFDNLALAYGYNLARERLPGDPRFAAVRPALERRLRRARLAVFGTGRAYFNYYLVEAAAVLELLRTGLRSGRPGTVLADRDGARRQVVHLIGRVMPRAAATSRRMSLLSDPPHSPLAYHAMTLGMLSHALALLGEAAPSRARTLFDRLARATWVFMAPDGDLAWAGRSQEQSWTLALTAAGLEAAANADPASAAGFRGASERALLRLGLVHAGGPGGLWIVPSLAGGLDDERIDGMDGYATATAYGGLTLLGLEWAAAEQGRAAASRNAAGVGGVAADAPGGHVMGGDQRGAFAVVRAGPVWFSVRKAPADHAGDGPIRARDLRYDAGLSALKVLDRRGWRTIVPARPITRGRFDGAGPLLYTGAGALARPVGTRLSVDAAGVVTLAAQMRTERGRVVRRAAIVYAPIACGVRIDVFALPGERWEFSGFFEGVPTAAPDGSVSDGTQVIRTSLPAALAVDGGYRSGMSPLTRGRLSFAPASGPFAIEICAG